MKTISAKEIIDIIEHSEVDPTVKEILIRDIKEGGVTDFLVEQVVAYCDKAIAQLNKRAQNQKTPA
ncbi:MAG: hypothetical protein P4L74_02195 [Candidatus Doudnabacteria bacterium]|nr:hypothetical protein [Candidatus Doudnabacteria bacterium]